MVNELTLRVWCWLVTYTAATSERVEREEANIEHGTTEATYLAYEWEHVSHDVTHVVAMIEWWK